ncbi:MAG: hypothetical protein AB1700_08270, partial [Bacillota bacterium]
GAVAVIIGVMLFLMPWASSKIAMLPNMKTSPFSILTGAAFVLGLINIILGLALFKMKSSQEEEE